MGHPAFRNAHLSFSRLSRFEQCPRSYAAHYIEKLPAEPGLPLRFGKMIHSVLEHLVREAIENERIGYLSEDRMLVLYRDAWSAEGLTGIDVFEEGLGILRDFIRQQGAVNPRNIVALEKEFRLPVGPFTVLGYIDRIDRVDHETARVIDYKSNHQLFTRDEVDTSLQLSLYAAAVKKLYPWVKKVELAFWMLRHCLQQETSRTEQQISDALAYIETLGWQTEKATEFPARLNLNCAYCDHRTDCPAYADALQGKREFLSEDLADLEAVAREREEVARLAKVLYARKSELDAALKTHLQDKPELVLGKVRYRNYTTTSFDYPIDPTVGILANATGRTRDELLGELGAIDKKALDALVKSLGKSLDKPRVSLLKAELEAHASKTHSPRFASKEVA